MHVVVGRLRQLSTSIKVGELHYMLSLIQLALNVDSLKAEAKLKHTSTSARKIALLYAPGVAVSTFKDWVTFGKRLIVVCGGATLYVLPIIAALGMRTDITRRETSEDDLLSLATALRRVQHGMWLPMVKRMMVPCMRASTGYINSLMLHRHIPVREGEAPKTESFGFADVAVSDRIFDSVQTHLPFLIARSDEWNATKAPLWTPLTDPELLRLPATVTIRTPLQFKTTPCPVNKKNRNEWTETERTKAEQAAVAASIDDLEAKLNDLHAGGEAKAGQYALRIEDSTGQLLSFMFSVPEEYRKLLLDAIEHIYASMPGEFKDEDSRREFFQYLSCHYSWYARYAEKVLFFSLSLRYSSDLLYRAKTHQMLHLMSCVKVERAR
ncbi:hypothetical protein R3P38DRAFT_2556796 [Favolaschia claudopus]|uniref:Uncharacterized protein n=1 Tax=Favolaschia claudopus TaxID=2862362 RepID=A0AAW0A9R7_9AGAR